MIFTFKASTGMSNRFNFSKTRERESMKEREKRGRKRIFELKF